MPAVPGLPGTSGCGLSQTIHLRGNHGIVDCGGRAHSDSDREARALVAGWESYVFLLALVAYDLWSTHKVHRVTLWAGVLLIFIQNIRFPIANTPAWHSFAAWVQMHAR